MTAQLQTLSEVTHRATDALIKEIGVIDTMHFLSQFRSGTGNYTEERAQLTTLSGHVRQGHRRRHQSATKQHRSRMRAVRQVYDRIPPMIEIPEALQHRCIEVAFTEIEAASCQHDGLQPEWPDGLFVGAITHEQRP